MNKIERMKGDKQIKDFVDLPHMSSKETIVAMKILNYMVPPTFMTLQPLFLVIAAKMVNLSLEYGNTGESSYGYAVYGIVLVEILQDYKNGFEYGAMALELSIKLKNDIKKCLACEVLVGHLNHWHKPLSLSNELTEIGFKAGINSGELQFAGYIYLYQAYNRFFEGANLQQYISEMEKFLEFTEKTKNQHASDVVNGCKLFAQYLSESKNNSYNLEIETHFKNAKERQSNLFVEGPYYTFKAFISFLEGDYNSCILNSEIADEKKANVPGVIIIAENKYIRALGILSILKKNEKTDSEKEKYLNQIDCIQSELKILSDVSPENFYHKYTLIQAELAFYKKKFLDAMYLYKDSIQSAKENGFIQSEAIACELAAYFYLELNLEDFANVYFERSLKCYKYWGANRKIDIMQNLFSKFQIYPYKGLEIPSKNESPFTIANYNSEIDINSIIKAMQSISGEIVLEKLLTNMIQIIIENAGAEKGLLVLEAEAYIVHNSVCLYNSTPLEETKNLPISMIQYVYRTGDNIVIYDAIKNINWNNENKDPIKGHQFTSDSYFSKNKVRSILCLPLKNHGNTIGILYLENNLMPGAFTKSRIETVKLLSVQAVISIENARFYEELESKVKDRTKALNSTLDVIKKDLLIAQKIQQNTLPLDLERLGPLKFTIKYLPMTEVGGDFFDIIKVRSGVYRIFRADATGHGVQAALVTMAIKSEYENLKHTISEPTVMIDILNRTYQRRYSSLNSFFTCVVLDNNLHTDKLTYAFAGHPAQILIHNNEIIQLERTGKMIGLSKTMNLTSKQYDFVLGDKILLFTDGIFEEFNQEGELFGEEKFNSIIYKNKMTNNEQIISQVLKEVTKFKGGLEQDDDITMIGIEL